MKTLFAALACSALACHALAATKLPATADALAQAMQGSRVVLLGEVHDNAAQHALRAEALRKMVRAGARPAIAFDQFDRGAQDAIDRARRERPGDVDYLIAQGKGAPSWGSPMAARRARRWTCSPPTGPRWRCSSMAAGGAPSTVRCSATLRAG